MLKIKNMLKIKRKTVDIVQCASVSWSVNADVGLLKAEEVYAELKRELEFTFFRAHI